MASITHFLALLPTTMFRFASLETTRLCSGNPVMTFFIFWVAYRYGHLKLGPKDAEPEFSDAAYFSMLFSAGVVSVVPFDSCTHFDAALAERLPDYDLLYLYRQGVGLFFFGVSEPLYHQRYARVYPLIRLY